LAALWANLHAGFAGWLAILAWLVIASALERRDAAVRRYGLLAALSAAATLANPYGWQLHRHILSYVNSPWILDHVEEFQSPRIRSENMMIFAVLLLVGVAAATRIWRRGRWFEASLVFVFGLAALRSARHIPLFAVVAAPVIAWHCARWWRRRVEWAPAGSAVRVLWESGQALGAQRGITIWMPILGALGVAAVLPPVGLADFPAEFFPVAAVTRNIDRLAASPAPRILTSEQWGDYLIYRLYPRTRVFYDGRSDFYGERVGEDYQVLMNGGRRSREVMARYRFNLALLPLDWPLGQLLERDPDWRVVDRDAHAVLLERNAGTSRTVLPQPFRHNEGVAEFIPLPQPRDSVPARRRQGGARPADARPWTGVSDPRPGIRSRLGPRTAHPLIAAGSVPDRRPERGVGRTPAPASGRSTGPSRDPGRIDGLATSRLTPWPVPESLPYAARATARPTLTRLTPPTGPESLSHAAGATARPTLTRLTPPTVPESLSHAARATARPTLTRLTPAPASESLSHAARATARPTLTRLTPPTVPESLSHAARATARPTLTRLTPPTVPESLSHAARATARPTLTRLTPPTVPESLSHAARATARPTPAWLTPAPASSSRTPGEAGVKA
jgi:hypothetical protein